MRGLVLPLGLTHGDAKKLGDLLHGRDSRILGHSVTDLTNLHYRHSSGFRDMGKVCGMQGCADAIHEGSGLLCHVREDTKKNLQETFGGTNYYLHL